MRTALHHATGYLYSHLDFLSNASLCADGDLDAPTNGHASMSEEDSDPDVAALGEEDLRKELLKVQFLISLALCLSSTPAPAAG